MFLLRPRDGGWVVDGTVGMGGHSERLMESGDGRTRLLGVDADREALRRAGVRLARFGERIVLRHGSFRGLGSIAAEAGIAAAAAILLDLGMSSYQLGESGRGFSFQNDEELDMRFDPSNGPDRRRAAESAPRRGARADHLRVRGGAPCAPYRPRHRRSAAARAARADGGPRRRREGCGAASRVASAAARRDADLPGDPDRGE